MKMITRTNASHPFLVTKIPNYTYYTISLCWISNHWWSYSGNSRSMLAYSLDERSCLRCTSFGFNSFGFNT